MPQEELFPFEDDFGDRCTTLADTATISFPLSTFFFTLIHTSDLIHVTSIASTNTLSDLQLLLNWRTNLRITKFYRIFTLPILAQASRIARIVLVYTTGRDAPIPLQ